MNSDNLLNFVTAAIEWQESQGQQEVLRNSTLPKKCRDWDLLKRWGIAITGEADDLFYTVRLPDGWTKNATGHSMYSDLLDDRGLYSDLLDDRGLQRADIFYKAAFYDRSAHISPFKNRFVLREDYQKDPEDGLIFHVFDLGLNRFVKRCQGGTYAYLKSDPSAIGFLMNGGVFLSDARGKYDDARFVKTTDGSAAIAISDDVFYKQYHHVNSCHEVIDASKRAATSEAHNFIAKIPKAYQWQSKFDFPEV